MRLNSKDKRSVFAAGLCFYKLFWIFFIGSFLGVICETVYCFVVCGHFEIRWGLIYGPFNPVYGFGALLMTIVAYKVSHRRDLLIFLICMILGAVCEYFCSFFQEKIFHTISWDYSDTQFNFDGRTNMLYAFCWGILGIIWVKDICPRLSRYIEKLPMKLGKILTNILVVYLALNILISGLATWRQSKRFEGIPAKNWIDVTLDKYYTDDFLKIFYPNTKIVKK
ncbi:MAG: putative ABC transporter permease [Clostridia bacterium]|nr:putative ABC transporter permease [Clostridia bacterium]